MARAAREVAAGAVSRWSASRPLRRAVRHRALGLAGAAVVAVLVAGQVRGAESVRQRWGPAGSVLVAVRDLPPGRQLDGADVERVTWPAALVPPGALRALPEGGRLRAGVGEGEVLVAHRVDSGGRGAWASVLDPTEVAVQVPLVEPLRGATPGDRVDVMAPDPTTVPDVAGALPATRIATDARVLELTGSTATLAVHRDDVTATAGAALAGLVWLVVLP